MHKVSVIVAVFNLARYIRKCVQSILEQSSEDIEVIIINDGSVDESRQIIINMVGNDNRIIFIESLNEGVSAARNKGLKVAKGKYIGFVDADDWIQPNMQQVLYEKAEIAGADLAICNVNLYDNQEVVKSRPALTEQVIDVSQNLNEAILSLMDFKFDYVNWNKLYRRDLINKQAIIFEAKMTVWEDLLFNLIFLYHVKTLVTKGKCYIIVV